MKILASFTLLAVIPWGAAAGVNTIYLRDGRTFTGRFVDGNTGTINFQDDNGEQRRFRTSEIQTITFDNRNGSQDQRPNLLGPAGQNQGRGQYRGNYPVLPVGTELSVRTTTTINSKDANDGQTFSASVDRDVLDASGNVLIPRGSPTELVVRDQNNGSIRNSSNLTLDVQSVTVNGQRFLIDTEDLQQRGNGREGVGKNRRTGEFVGGGTALGAIIGAVAGGGKGALIGALAGAAAGAGTQVLTKGSEVRVPSETVLTFRIDQPVTLNPRN